MPKLRPVICALVGPLVSTLVLTGCAGNGPAGGGAAGSAVGMAEVPAAATAVAPIPANGPVAERVLRPVATPDTPGLAGRDGLVSVPAGPSLPLKDIFFDTDRSRIREDGQATLRADLAWLRANPGVRITMEGHCDERGTSEYNLALGDRRARAVRDYFVAAGLAPARINTVSYGKERPFVPGHDEAAWRWNRRAHFSVAFPQLSQQR